MLALLPGTAGHILTAFHNDQEKRAIRNGASIASFQMLKQQIAVYRDILKDMMGETRTQITEKQRDANRELEPNLTVSMVPSYQACVAEVGGGQYKRMKAYMTAFVDQERATMFDNCCNHVQIIIKQLLKEVREQLLEKIDGIYVMMEREYTSVVLGQDTGSSALLPREQRTLRKEVLAIVDGAEFHFKVAVGLEEAPDPTPESERVVREPDETAAIAEQTSTLAVEGSDSLVMAEPAQSDEPMESIDPATAAASVEPAHNSVEQATAIKTEATEGIDKQDAQLHPSTIHAPANEGQDQVPKPRDSMSLPSKSDAEMEDV